MMSQAYVPYAQLISDLQKLCRERRTGIIYVATDTNHSAQVNLDKGEVVFVVFRSKLGESALSLMPSISTCRFRFAEGSVPTATRMRLPATSEILERLASGVRRSDSGRPREAATPVAQEISSEAKTILERALAEYIGPMVSIVCPEHFEGARDLRSVIEALACEIPTPEHAIQFKQDVSRKLRLQ
jgi:hypothetical protein